MLVVDPWHWLTPDGNLPADNPPLRKQVLRVAQVIEYGGPLLKGARRETLICCTRRPNRKPCIGLLWVEKTEQDSIHAFCPTCRTGEMLVSNWQDTIWAEGPMEPLAPETVRAGPVQNPPN